MLTESGSEAQLKSPLRDVSGINKTVSDQTARDLRSLYFKSSFCAHSFFINLQNLYKKEIDFKEINLGSV